MKILDLWNTYCSLAYICLELPVKHRVHYTTSTSKLHYFPLNDSESRYSIVLN